MEKKFNIVVGEDGTVKLPDAVLEKLEVKPGEEVRFEVDDKTSHSEHCDLPYP